MRRLILCLLLPTCCGCVFASHQGPLTLGGRWHSRIPPAEEAAAGDDIVVRAQSAANETQRTLASTLEIAELVLVRAPIFVVGTAVLRPLGMHPELTRIEERPRPVCVLTTHSPDGNYYFEVTKHPLQPAAKDRTVELGFRIIRPRGPKVHVEQTFRIADDVTFEHATPEWDFEKSLVTITADNGRRFTISYATAIDNNANPRTIEK